MATPVFDPNIAFEEVGTSNPATDIPVFDPNGKFEDVTKTYDPLASATTSAPLDTADPLTVRLSQQQGRQESPAIPWNGWGLDPNEYKDYLIQGGQAGKYAHTPLGLAANIADYGVVPFQAIGRGAEWAAKGLDTIAEQSGLADALSWDGNKFLPGTGVMALGEAFPLGGAESGIVHPIPSRPSRLTPDIEEAYINVARTGTPEEIIDFANANKFRISPEEAEAFVTERNRAGGITPTVKYSDTIDTPVFDPSKWSEPVNGTMTGDFGSYKVNVKQKAVQSLASKDSSGAVNNAVDHINTITKDWNNTPSIEVFENFDNLPDVDSEAIGVTRPDNSVAINMKSVRAEAEALGVHPNDILTAATYHESLGHYGLSERFGQGLNDFLMGLYDNSTSFKRRVNKRISDNPNDYIDDINPIASHAEEVLAEMSEKGQISPTLMNKLKDLIKGYGRQMGFQIKYSDREIRSILSTAHDTVVNGSKGSAVGNLTNRYMYAGLQSKIKSWPENTGEGQWFTGPDGVERYEISDKDSVFNSERFANLSSPEYAGKDYQYELKDVLDHPELYAAYPELKKLRIGVLPEGAGRGEYSEKGKVIRLAASAEDKRSLALHEIQHAIQGIEDTARGGSPETAFNYMDKEHLKKTLNNVLEWDKKRLDQTAEELQLLEEARNTPEAQDYLKAHQEYRYRSDIAYDLANKLGEEDPSAIRAREEANTAFSAVRPAEMEFRKALGLTKDYSELSKAERKAYSKFDELVRSPGFFEGDLQAFSDNFTRHDKARAAIESGDRSAIEASLRSFANETGVDYQAYQSLLGEVEARDVQARADLTPEERAQTAPYSSQAEIAPEDSYIVHRWQSLSKGAKDKMSSKNADDPRNTPDDPAVKLTAELFGIPEDRIPRALTERDFLGQVFLTRRQMEKGLTEARYMKRRTIGPGSKGVRQGSMNDLERTDETPRTIIPNYTSKRNVEEILSEVTPERAPETWEQWIDESGKIKMTGKVAQHLSAGTTPPELKAAQRYLLESSNRIFDLSKKVAAGSATEREAYLLGAEMQRAKNVAESIDEVVTNAARLLNSQKIEVASDKALSDGIRNMLRSISQGDLSDPVKLAKLAKGLEKGNKRAKVIGKSMELLANALNFPRTIMASMDLSAPLRQGIVFVGDKALWKNIPTVFKAWGSDAAYDAVMSEIKSRPTYRLMDESGLAFGDVSGTLSAREERFMSQWAEKIPGVKASERAYTAFLNKLRADVFDDLVDKYKEAGIDLKPLSDKTKGVATFVNNATGRGDLGRLNQAAPLLSGLFFSPRLIASRVNMLNPIKYAKMDPIVRKKALTSMAKLGAVATSVAMLAKMAGADVETDPRSSDFAKIKVDSTRYDILGGFGQYLTLGARLATNEKKNVKGDIVELGKKYGSDTRLDVLMNFLINKESPVASFVTDYLRGKNAIGEPFDAKKKAAESFIPLFLQDSTDLIKEEGAKGVPMSIPGLFGVGMQTYDIDLGYDAYGRDIKTKLSEGGPETDPVVLAVQTLVADPVNEFNGLPEAPKSFKEDGIKYSLTEEQTKEWQRVMGEYTHQYLTEDMGTEEYTTGDAQDKIEIIKKAHSDAYKDTKVYFLDNVFTSEHEGAQ